MSSRWCLLLRTGFLLVWSRLRYESHWYACSPEEPWTGSRPWPSAVRLLIATGLGEREAGIHVNPPGGLSRSARLWGIWRDIPLRVSTTAMCRTIPDRFAAEFGGGGRSVLVSSSGESALMCSGQGEEELLEVLSVFGVGAARLGKALFEVGCDEREAGPV